MNRVKDLDLCSQCLVEIGAVMHSTCSCDRIEPFISHVIVFLKTKCKVGVDINMKNYLFRFQGNKFSGSITFSWKFIFYNLEENDRVEQFI